MPQMAQYSRYLLSYNLFFFEIPRNDKPLTSELDGVLSVQGFA